MTSRLEITLGPLLFNWAPDRVTTFYERIARETTIDRVYLGEVVCGKREPFLGHALAEAAEHLHRAGKIVVWSSLALPATPRDRASIRRLGACSDLIEANDISVLHERPPSAAFVAGPLLNVYNEAAATELVSRGCVRLCANVELPLRALSHIHGGCPDLELEIFAFGRLPLALSGRCYHARAHGLHRDNCQFVCDRDLDGMDVRTLEGQPFLAVNGVQTLSHGVHLACPDLTILQAAGVTALRLSPHTADMVSIAKTFRAYADGELEPAQVEAEIESAGLPGPLINGYLHGRPGDEWVG